MRILTILLAYVAIAAEAGSLFSGRTTAVTELDISSYRKTLQGAIEPNAGDWIVFHYSTMCGHCHAFAPYFIKIAEAYTSSKLRFGAIALNTYENHVLMEEKDIRGVPHVEHIQVVRSASGSHRSSRRLVHDPTYIRAEIERLYPEASPRRTVSQERVPFVPSGPSKLKQDSRSFIEDANAALSSVLHLEVFKGNSETLSIPDMEDLVKVLRACEATWPTSGIRMGCAKLLANVQNFVDSIRPLTRSEWKKILQDPTINLPSPSNIALKSCPTMTCALWRVLHIFATGLGGKPYIPFEPKEAMEAIRVLVDKFFSCTECRQHFLQHFDGCDFGRCESSNPSWKQTTLWLWRFHNAVSARVHPDRPLWPSETECSGCRVNEEQLYAFLVSQFTSNDVASAQFASSEKSTSLNSAFFSAGIALLGFIAFV